jgi:hypothetical protein
MRYAKDAKEFNASLSKSKNRDGSISMICRIPKPILVMLGEPSGIKFVIQGKKIVVSAGDKK